MTQKSSKIEGGRPPASQSASLASGPPSPEVCLSLTANHWMSAHRLAEDWPPPVSVMTHVCISISREGNYFWMSPTVGVHVWQRHLLPDFPVQKQIIVGTSTSSMTVNDCPGLVEAAPSTEKPTNPTLGHFWEFRKQGCSANYALSRANPAPSQSRACACEQQQQHKQGSRESGFHVI